MQSVPEKSGAGKLHEECERTATYVRDLVQACDRLPAHAWMKA